MANIHNALCVCYPNTFLRLDLVLCTDPSYFFCMMRRLLFYYCFGYLRIVRHTNSQPKVLPHGLGSYRKIYRKRSRERDIEKAIERKRLLERETEKEIDIKRNR